MASARTLHLRRETLTELTPGELGQVVAGEYEATRGTGCRIVAAVLIVTIVASLGTTCICEEEQPVA